MLLHSRSLTHSEVMLVLISMQENDKFLGILKCLSGECGLEKGKTAHFIMVCVGAHLKKRTFGQGNKVKNMIFVRWGL